MANNKRIRVLRTDKLTAENQLTVLEDGQPFYDKETRYLYIGNGNPINDPTSNIKTESIIAENATHADVAEMANYASSDKSKGTIEERLTRLGFKQGAFDVITTDGSAFTVNSNNIKSQGYYCIANIDISFASSNI